ncbi:peptide deformylase [Brucella tritici]|uniref:Peptide deformylase-like n=1 Tax=Brucella tritici TaxID=94626 RepID=A0A7V7VWT9_9HYPH|nr:MULTISPECIES: peptide deformylase [Brucella]KAB2658441.1 peptide deformylase [Brucella tritici]KXO75574.1 peptide deformylase [Brucella anthropi]
MTIRPIVNYPDKRLRVAAEPVTLFDGALQELGTDLLDTMRAAPGIGITAPHIGISTRLVVLELPTEPVPKFYVNPEIVWASEEKIHHQEGSVSMPGVVDEVERHARITIRYQDINGNEQTEESEGLLAVCHQHEIDQLDGIFWIQRLSRLRRDRLIKRYEKSQRQR